MDSLRALKPLIWACLTFAPYRLIISLCLMLISSVASGIGILLIIPLLASVGIDVGGTTVNQAVIEAIELIVNNFGIALSLGSILSLYLLIIVVVAAVGYMNTVLSEALRQSFVVNLRNDLANKLFLTRWQYLNHAHMSDFIRLLTNQVQMVGGSINLFLKLTNSLILIVVYLFFTFIISVKVTGFALFGALALMAIVWPINRHIRFSGRVKLKANMDMHRAIFDDLTNLKAIKSYGAEEHYLQRIYESNKVIEEQQVRLASYNAFTRLVNLIGAAAIFSLVLYSAINWFSLPVANVFVVLFIFSRLMPHVASIQGSLQSIIHQAPSYQDLLNRSDELVEWSELRAEQKHSVAPSFESQIELRELGFKHLEAEHLIIENLSAIIKQNQTTAITGPSGAGKSTLADLLSGLLEPTAGKILIDGEEISDANRRAWRQKVAYVTQDVFLFHDSVCANLSWILGGESLEEDSGVMEKKIWHALELAAAAEFVRNLPQGLDTIIGDRGVKLSGGERQRLALARALLSQPMLLILDEATSALDRGSELIIRDALVNLDGKITIIIIAHNEITIEHVAQKINLTQA